jgi:hypothetical protein
MNIIAFSLWGDKPKYTVGALHNAKLAKTYYRNWKCWFYCDRDTVPEGIIQSLEAMDNVKIIFMKASQEPHWAAFWRFYPMGDPSVERCIFRDTDSRIGQRESMAVQNWISSGKDIHVMRDHPAHGVPICAGMWGALAKPFLHIRNMIDDYYRDGVDKTKTYGDIDQDFLKKKVWDAVNIESVLVHDEFFAKKPFPTPRDPKHFVGQVYDENDNPQF